MSNRFSRAMATRDAVRRQRAADASEMRRYPMPRYPDVDEASVAGVSDDVQDGRPGAVPVFGDGGGGDGEPAGGFADADALLLEEPDLGDDVGGDGRLGAVGPPV